MLEAFYIVFNIYFMSFAVIYVIILKLFVPDVVFLVFACVLHQLFTHTPLYYHLEHVLSEFIHCSISFERASFTLCIYFCEIIYTCLVFSTLYFIYTFIYYQIILLYRLQYISTIFWQAMYWKRFLDDVFYILNINLLI